MYHVHCTVVLPCGNKHVNTSPIALSKSCEKHLGFFQKDGPLVKWDNSPTVPLYMTAQITSETLTGCYQDCRYFGVASCEPPIQVYNMYIYIYKILKTYHALKHLYL